MKRRLTAWIAAIAATASLAACASGGSASAGDATAPADADNPVTVRVGVTDKAQEYWTTFTDLAAEEGIEVELVNFTEYPQPNPTLSQGSST